MVRNIVKAVVTACVGLLVAAQGALADPTSSTLSLNALDRGSTARVRLRFVYTGNRAATSDRGCRLTIRGCTYQVGSADCERSRVIARRTLAKGKRKSSAIVVVPTIDVNSEEESQILAMQVRTSCPDAESFDSPVDAANVSCDGGVTPSQFLSQLRTAFDN